jgi:ATP-binding cassette, subfamily B, bacterial PglK
LRVAKNTTVGIVGLSGSGKTTLIDVLLGLLWPTTGQLLVDGVPVESGNLAAWRAKLGYVPQHIFLAEDTVARNIAFGLPDSEIDRMRVIHAARLASLHEFVETELPGGYEAQVGERGIRLSGGQRQRIGIARALYHDPDVLLLDEATSALDGMTEDTIIDSLNALAHTKTIILIAHRFTTIRDCDVIYMLDAGEVVDSGTYTELISRNAAFRALGKIPEDGPNPEVVD